MEVLGKETSAVGMKISTKAVGSNARQDVTLDYKYAEGRALENIFLPFFTPKVYFSYYLDVLYNLK